MTVYITGLAGTIGNALYRLHSRLGDDVKGCDLRQHVASDRINILNTEALAEHMRGSRIVYHCAAMLGVKNTEDHPEICKQINIEGTRSVIHAARKAGVEHFVMLSSSEVYGKHLDRVEPLREDDDLHADNVYALTKIQNELDVLKVQDMRTTTVRMFNTYGPWQVRQFVITRFMDAAFKGEELHVFGDHSHKRSYLYSQDAARYIYDVARYAPHRSVVNISAFEPVTLKQLANCVLTVCNSKSYVRTVTDRYDDRLKTRDMPWRVGDTTQLMRYSKHKPLSLVNGLYLMAAKWDTTIDDWCYERELYS